MDDVAVFDKVLTAQRRAGVDKLPTKIAPDGTIRIFDPAANTFGAYTPGGLTKTFFKPTSPGYWGRQPGKSVL